MEMQRGQRLPLSKITDNRNQFEVSVLIDGIATDIALFGIDSNEKLSDDRYMIFYNQLVSPCSSIKMQTTGQETRFVIRPLEIPSTIDRMIVVASVESGKVANMRHGHMKIMDGNNEKAIFRFSGADFENERAVIIAEFYRKTGEWRVAATGQGFNGGLEALVKHYGGEIAESRPAPTPPPPPPAPKINLSKITLSKNQTISLEKKGSGFGQINVNLNWNRSGSNAGVDLDLGCLFELSDGTKGGVQALGNRFGQLNQPPYIELMGDDRTGQSADGENLLINGKMWSQIKRIMIFAFIYEGAPRWSSTDAVVTIKAPDQPEIIVALDEYSKSDNFCVVAMLENKQGEVRITKHITYHDGHQEADRSYQFGLRYQPGRK